MNFNKTLLLNGALFLIVLFSLILLSAADSTSVVKTQYFSPTTSSFDSSYSSLISGTASRGDSSVAQGEEFFDMAVTIPPLGCQPYVVRSDLLEEQNVPVFCQLVPLKVNAGIDITRIERVSVVQKDQNPYISGVGFHPALAAISSSISNQFSNPNSDNLGYVVVVLKRNENEKSMPENVTATLAIQMQYGANYAYGIGETEFYLPVMTDAEFSNNFQESSFYDGIGYLRVEDVDETGATISVYDTYGQSTSGFRRVFSDRIEIGKVSRDFYLYSYSGGQGIRVNLKEITVPEVKAKIKVNGQLFDVYKGNKFYNGKCTLNDVSALPGKTGYAKVVCNSKTFELQKKFNDINIIINGQDSISYALGQEIVGLSNDTDKVYLVYAGQKSDAAKSPFIILTQLKADEVLKSSATDLSTKIVALNKEVDRNLRNSAGIVDADKLKTLLASTSATGFSGSAKFYNFEAPSGLDSTSFVGRSIRVETLMSSDAAISDGTNSASDYFKFAKESYDYVKSSFGAESSNNLIGVNEVKSSFTAGEYALWKEYELANSLGQKESAKTILSRIENEYPSSVWNGQSAHGLLSSLGLLSSEGSTGYDEKTDLSIELVSVTEPSNEEASVSLSYNGKPVQPYYKGGIIADDKKVKISLKSFDENKIYLDYVCMDNNGNNKSSSSAGFAGNGNFLIPDCGGARININKINLKKVAHIQIVPITYGRSRESNFTFTIGIEKRALSLDLTPEEANKKLTELNKEIAEWRNITESLGEFIKVEKTACLATTGIINLVNLVSGASGEATARQEVMKKWNAYCKDSANLNGSENQEDCIANNYDKSIKPEIEATQKLMNGYNKLYEDESKNKLNQDAKGKTNDTMVKEALRAKIVEQITGIEFYETNGGKIDCKTPYNASANLSCTEYAQWLLAAKNLNYIDYGDLSSLYYNLQMAQNTKLLSYKQYSAAAYSTLKQIEDRSQVLYQAEKGLSTLGLGISDFDTILSGKQTREIIYTGKKFQNLPESIQKKITDVEKDTNLTDGTNRVSMAKFTDGGIYVYVLGGSETSLHAIAIYKIGENDAKSLISKEGNILNSAKDAGLEQEAKLAKDIKLTISDATSYKNKCTNCNEVKVYNTEPYKGMIALLPFDCNEGWYVQTKQLFTGLGTGNQKTFLDSGKVNSFWLCNVGKNGLLDGQGISDDKCTKFDLNTGNSLDSIGGLTQAQAKSKISQAINAIEKAQSELIKSPTTINSGSCSNLKVKNSELDSGSKCTDFMSPDQCQLIFNVCDPVVCPNSRCDFGGTYPVDNVIQSGVIGSTFLCLPNFIGFHPKTGVIIPVCLTGINAGLENWISILEAYRDCINESVTNNKTVGICDAVHSVYVCDFFWKQAGPIVQALSKNLFYAFFGKGEHGGGEYLFVNDAWSNAEKSVQYFQTLYGDDSNLKFGFRDISNAVADEVCKAGASASYPDNFDSMLEAESPVQFTAFFEEMSYTDATAQPRSQYKVSYHIFAGNEQGHYYQVYLKSAPTSLGYVGKDMSVVKSGYVAKGGYASESVDFIDVAGFKELCVRIDAQDKCGFKSVSTSAALNYAKDTAVSNQATETVVSEGTCVSGSTNLGSLLTPNIQQAATEAVNPAIYNQGIIRVCANENPGKSVDPARWSDVGYCDDKTIRCWLDTQSVKNAIKGKGIENYTLQQIQNLSIKNLIDQQGYLPSNEAARMIKELRAVYLGTDSNSGVINSISPSNLKGSFSSTYKDTQEKTYTNRNMNTLDEDVRALDKLLVMSSQRAALFFVKAEIYDRAALKTKDFNVDLTKKNTSSGSGSGVVSSVVSTVVVSYDPVNKQIMVNIDDTPFYFDVGTNTLKYLNDQVGVIGSKNSQITMNQVNLKAAGISDANIKLIAEKLDGKTLIELTSSSSVKAPICIASDETCEAINNDPDLFVVQLDCENNADICNWDSVDKKCVANDEVSCEDLSASQCGDNLLVCKLSTA